MFKKTPIIGYTKVSQGNTTDCINYIMLNKYLGMTCLCQI